MSRIRVICGTVGIFSDGMFQTKTSADGFFDVSDETAERFVERGVAEYADSKAETVETVVHEEPEQEESSDLSSMTNSDLKKMAEELGGDASHCKNKAQLIALVEELSADSDEDDELPPVWSAADPV